MKRNIKSLCMVAVTSMLLTACGNTSADISIQSQEATVADNSIEQQTQEEQSSTTEAATTTSVSKKTPEEDFETANLSDGTVSIKRYLGDATEVVIPETIGGKAVTAIEGAFNCNYTVESVIMPDTVTKIGTGSFAVCSKLKNVQMSANIKEIGTNAFLSCSSLETIELPEGLKIIGESAFSSSSLKRVTIPTTVEEKLYFSFGGINIESITIPANIKEIGEQTFCDCIYLKEVVVEDGVETIGERTFAYCENLERIVIPASVTEMYGNTFQETMAVTIVGEAGSYAESYAKEWDIPFEAQ